MKIKIGDAIIIILTIISLAVGLWYLFGNSPTFEQALIILILTVQVSTIVKITQVGSRLNLLEKSFGHLAKDFKESKRGK